MWLSRNRVPPLGDDPHYDDGFIEREQKKIVHKVDPRLVKLRVQHA